MATIEVVEVGGRDDGAVARGNDPLRVVGAVVPCLEDGGGWGEDGRGDFDVGVEEDVFPVDCGAVEGGDEGVGGVDEGGEEGGGGVARGEEGADGGVGGPAGGGDFVGSRVEVRVGEEGGEVGEYVAEEVVGFGVEGVELAGAGLGGEPGGP